eukprot:XP_001706901.1 Hypothetical protein GL50803_36833 [Giardia lamblia ATCC 50803]
MCRRLIVGFASQNVILPFRDGIRVFRRYCCIRI